MSTEINLNTLNEAILQFELLNNKKVKKVNKENKLCNHLNTVKEGYIILCSNCGEELEKNNFRNKEWKNYEAGHNVDPYRCHLRKNIERSIHGDVVNMGFNDKIIYMANQLYMNVTQGKIKRGISRKSIVFACMFQAHSISDIKPDFENFIKRFNLKRNSALKGVKYVNIKIPKDFYETYTYTTPLYYIKEIMDVFNAQDYQIQESYDIYNKIKNKSLMLNGSKARSIASGIVYYWLCKNNKDISIKEFIKRVDLSELTIKKMAKEIERIDNIVDAKDDN